MSAKITPMAPGHIDVVQAIDSCCNESHYPVKNFRAAMREKPSRAFVFCDQQEGSNCPEVLGYVVLAFRSGSSTIHIERIGARSDSDWVYDRLLANVYFLADQYSKEKSGSYSTEGEEVAHRAVERITAIARVGDLNLRAKLSQNGFYVTKQSTDGMVKTMALAKVMIESTWAERTHYPFGADIIHEILHGDGAVLYEEPA